MWWKGGLIPVHPVYLVCPRYWEGHSQTLHRKCLLPISSSLEQIEKDAPMAGVEHTSTSVPMPCVGSEPTDAEPSRMATSGTTGYSSQGSLDQAAPLRCSTHTTQNQLPWRYWNFALVADTSLPGIFGVWVGLCICLHLISCLLHHSYGKYSVNTVYLCLPMSARHHSL